jgi:hypothetical protein
MVKMTSVKPAVTLTQSERLARKDKLCAEASKLEAQARAIHDEITALLRDCEHTDHSGRSAILGGATKVCAECGKTITGKNEKLWQ